MLFKLWLTGNHPHPQTLYSYSSLNSSVFTIPLLLSSGREAFCHYFIQSTCRQYSGCISCLKNWHLVGDSISANSVLSLATKVDTFKPRWYCLTQFFLPILQLMAALCTGWSTFLLIVCEESMESSLELSRSWLFSGIYNTMSYGFIHCIFLSHICSALAYYLMFAKSSEACSWKLKFHSFCITVIVSPVNMLIRETCCSYLCIWV